MNISPEMEKFKAEIKPSSAGKLRRLRGEIIELRRSGYSLKEIYTYVQQNGYGSEYGTFYKWVTRNSNFEEELARLNGASAGQSENGHTAKP